MKDLRAGLMHRIFKRRPALYKPISINAVMRSRENCACAVRIRLHTDGFFIFHLCLPCSLHALSDFPLRG
jgi:hypothetical protein